MVTLGEGGGVVTGHMGKGATVLLLLKYVLFDNSSNWTLMIYGLFWMCPMVPSCYTAVRRLEKGIKYDVHS